MTWLGKSYLSSKKNIKKLKESMFARLRYLWLWKKETPTGFLNANYKPLNAIEEITVFSKAKVGSLSKNPIPYHPPTKAMSWFHKIID